MPEQMDNLTRVFAASSTVAIQRGDRVDRCREKTCTLELKDAGTKWSLTRQTVIVRQVNLQRRHAVAGTAENCSYKH